MTAQTAWAVCGLLFFSGCACLVLRRQLLAMVLGLELMLNAANLALVYQAVQRQDAKALAVALCVIAVAAAEAVVGLCLILALRLNERAEETPELKGLAG